MALRNLTLSRNLQTYGYGGRGLMMTDGMVANCHWSGKTEPWTRIRAALSFLLARPPSGFSFSCRAVHTLLTLPAAQTEVPGTVRLEDLCKESLECCEPGRELRIGVLVSGGVDSSVALRLLCAAGHRCTGYYLKIWFQEDFENFWSSCPWDEDLKYAQAVCDEVGVDLHVLHLSNEYWKNVVSHVVAEYQAGRTPNPDVLCNSRIKFGAFFDCIKDMGFDRVASGHYARVDRVTTRMGEISSLLRLSRDKVKDQTYFLSHLSQAQLSKLIFPLGSMSKEEVRQLADLFKLPNKDRKDSQGICFLGKVKFSEFIARHLGEKEGCLVEAETGTFMGTHKGFWFYTIGQRQGIRLSHGPWYVVDKDPEHNVVFISRNYYSGDKMRRSFKVNALSWFAGCPPTNFDGLLCKVRHGARFYECSLSLIEGEGEGGSSAFLVKISEDDQGIAVGQYAAFYDKDICLGSGIISDTMANRASSVSEEARTAAVALSLSQINDAKQSSIAALKKIKNVTPPSSRVALPESKPSEAKKSPSPQVGENSNIMSWIRHALTWLHGTGKNSG